MLYEAWIRRAACALALLMACGEPETLAQGSPSSGNAAPDSGARVDAGTVVPKGDPSPDDVSDAPSTCAQVSLASERVVPNVWLLIDGSGSMVSGFDGLVGRSRWQVLRDALLTDATGLIARLGGSVAFGMMIYDGGLSPPGIKTDLCPGVREVKPARDNAAALRAAYPELPLGASTPTHYALQELQKRIAAMPASGPTYVVLATDGMPNLCDFHDGLPTSPDIQRDAVETVAALAADGIPSFTISLANGDPQLTTHLDALARAGGVAQGAFTPSSEDALAAALESIVGHALPCAVTLQGTVSPEARCAGKVLLGDRELSCDAPDGYRIGPTGQTLELTGEACKSLQTDPQAKLTATFPCHQATPII